MRLYMIVLSHFRDANRNPLRWKMLYRPVLIRVHSRVTSLWVG
jgi:hypothetical protein